MYQSSASCPVGRKLSKKSRFYRSIACSKVIVCILCNWISVRNVMEHCKGHRCHDKCPYGWGLLWWEDAWSGAASGISASFWRGSGLSEVPGSWGGLRVRVGAPRWSCCLVLPSQVAKPLPAWPSGDLPLACCPFPWQERPCPGWALAKFKLTLPAKKAFTEPPRVEKTRGAALSGLRVLSSSQHRLQRDGLGGTSGDQSRSWWAEQSPRGSPASGQTFPWRGKGEAGRDVQGGIGRGGCKAVNPARPCRSVTLLLPCWARCIFPGTAGHSPRSRSALREPFLCSGDLFLCASMLIDSANMQVALYENCTTVCIKRLWLLNQIIVKHNLS